MNDKKTARLAGLLYLIVVIFGTLYLKYIPSKINLKGNPSNALHSLMDAEKLFKIGIACEMICWLTFLVLPVILYKLFKPVNGTVAKLMVIFAIVQAPIAFINLLNKFAALYFISGSANLKIYTTNQLSSQILFYINLYHQGNFINQVFWGLWLFPFGYLAFKSNLIPKFLGILLMVGCVGYLVDFFATLLVQDYSKTIISNYANLPASLGEIGICLWLIIVGTKNNTTDKSYPKTLLN